MPPKPPKRPRLDPPDQENHESSSDDIYMETSNSTGKDHILYCRMPPKPPKRPRLDPPDQENHESSSDDIYMETSNSTGKDHILYCRSNSEAACWVPPDYSDNKSTNYCRLILFIQTICLEVMRRVLYILHKENGEQIRHHLFHLFFPQCCCRNPNRPQCTSHRKFQISEIWTDFYEEDNDPKYDDHKKTFPDQCACPYRPKPNASFEKFDLSVICSILISNFRYKPEMKEPVETIRQIRNDVMHAPKISTVDMDIFYKTWQSLETAIKSLSKFEKKLSDETERHIRMLKGKDIANADLILIEFRSMGQFESFDKEFYASRSLLEKEGEKILRRNGVLIIRGKGGDGKTTLALKIMKTFRSKMKTYIPVTIETAVEINHLLNSNEKYFVFVDDLLGKSNLQNNCINKWEKLFSGISKKVKARVGGEPTMFIILAIRENIMNSSETLRTHELFCEDNTLNLSNPKSIMTHKAKAMMFTDFCRHTGFSVEISNIKEYDIRDEYPEFDEERGIMQENITFNSDHMVVPWSIIIRMARLDTYYAFPYCCYLFVKPGTKLRGNTAVFTHPHETLENEIMHLFTSSMKLASRRNNKELSPEDCQGRTLFHLLVFSSLQRIPFCIKKINIKRMRQIETSLDIVSSSKPALTMATRCQNYLKVTIDKYDNVYCEIRHETIRECVLKILHRFMEHETLLSLADEDIILDFIRTSEYKAKREEVFLRIESETSGKLLQRLGGKILQSDTSNDPSFATEIVQHCVKDKGQFIHVLEEASKYGRICIVKELLHKDLKFGIESTNFTNAIAISIEHGDHDLVLNEIIKHHSQVVHTRYRVSENNLTSIKDLEVSPLLHSALRKRRKCAKLLIQKKSQLDILSSNGKTILHECALSDLNEICDLIVKRDDSLLHKVDNDGFTPLLTAASYKCEKSTMALIHHTKKSDLTVARKGNNYTVLHYAVRSNMTKVVQEIIARNDCLLNTLSKKAMTPTILSACIMSSECTKLLLEVHKDLSSIDHLGRNVLHYAARNGLNDICDLILVKDYSLLNTVDLYLRSPLIYAVFTEHKECAFRLLRWEPNITLRDKIGQNVLHYAARQDYPDICQILLKQNNRLAFDVNSNGAVPKQLIPNSHSNTSKVFTDFGL